MKTEKPSKRYFGTC